ncbi:MAG: Ig-like domain-containing protein [Hyphomicrobium sp.]
MGTIRVEFVPVKQFGLGLLFFDHLQVIYQDETDPIDSQDYWYVLEGVIDGGTFAGTLGALGEDGRTSLSEANNASREELIDKIGTPEKRGSRIVSTGPDALLKWDQIASYGGAIQEQRYPYIAYTQPFSASPTINSTSFIASALWSVGIDLSLLMPFGVRLSPGGSTLLGTGADDTLRTTVNFTTLVGGEGEDTFYGRPTSFYPEKFFGGAGNDTFIWSYGENVIDGGLPGLSTASDGVDTVDYSGVGTVHFRVLQHSVADKVATYRATFDGGSDRLFSIEQLAWDRQNDVLTASEGVLLLEKPVILDFKGQSGGQGDKLGFENGKDALIINAVNDTMTSIQLSANEGLDAGYWAQSIESLTASDRDDRIYAGPAILNVDGGKGDDVIDARLAAPFSGLSASGYDVELTGGDGDDTIVSGAGRTYALGGAGADMFVVSTMSSVEGQTIEYVLADADASDKLFVPFDYFRPNRGDYEGSRLFQVTGAPFDFSQPGEETYYFGPETERTEPGNEFIGAFTFRLDGADLIVTLSQAHYEELPPREPGGEPEIILVGEVFSETIVRVLDWSEGDLGIAFPLVFDPDVAATLDGYYDYPGLRDVLAASMAPSRFLDALEERPDPHVPLEVASVISTAAATSLRAAAASAPATEGGDGDDVLSADSGRPYQFNGRGGNDDITGTAGGDTLDGGAGRDTLRGGRGNDVYVVDDAGDVVIEEARGGFDRVVSSIDYALGENVEHLALRGGAIAGTGNGLRNTLEGNDADNTLSAGDGDDTLAGNRGDDVLIGGDGGDGYVYEPGDGRDVIIETGGAEAGDDVVVLVGGVAPGDVTLHRDPDAANDLIVRVGTDGGRITIRDYFAGAGLEAIAFETGESWRGDELAQRAAAATVVDNWSPVARDDAFAIKQQASFTIPLAALIDNDFDEDGDALSVSSVRAVSGGGVEITAAGDVRVTPDAGAGELAFDYTISDARGGAATARLTLTILPNAAPIITRAELAPAIEDQPAAGRIQSFDADGDSLTYAVRDGAGPAKGVVTLQDDGAFVFTPFENASGADGFTLTVSDSAGAAVDQAFAFDIAPVNDAPTAVADAGFSVRSGATLTLTPQQLLANDRDIDGDALTIAAVTAGDGLTVTRDASGGVVVTAAGGISGPRTFSYAISDGQGGTSSASVAIDVIAATPTNAAPIIQNAVLQAVREDHPARGRLVATDADGDPLTYAIAPDGKPHKGVVSLKQDGTFIYTPKRDANGPDSFVLTVTDGKSAPVTHTFNFTIKPDCDLRDIVHYDVLSHGGVLGKLAAIADFYRNARDDDWDGAYWKSIVAKFGSADAIDL